MQSHLEAVTELSDMITAHLTTAGAKPEELRGERVAFKRLGEDHLIINAEHSFCGLFADYYGEFQDNGGDPYILPAIEQWAERRGYELDWESPGAVAVYGKFRK